MSDIQDTGSAGNTFAESHKTYEFILTTSDMEIIKKYNSDREKDHGGYADFNLSCKCSEAGHESDTKCNGYFYDCRSNFINDLSSLLMIFCAETWRVKSFGMEIIQHVYFRLQIS